MNQPCSPMAGRLRDRLFEPPGARTSVPRNYRYFNEPLIEVNLVFSFVRRPFTTAKIASAMPGGDQSIFDCRRAGLVSPESRQCDYAWTL
jgi:hypothetical protein